MRFLPTTSWSRLPTARCSTRPSISSWWRSRRRSAGLWPRTCESACWVISRSSMRALTPTGPTTSSVGAVTPITMRAAAAPGLPYRHTIISTNGTDRSDRWVTSGSGALSAHLREQIALTVGQANECGYCIAAHSAIGAGASHRCRCGPRASGRLQRRRDQRNRGERGSEHLYELLQPRRRNRDRLPYRPEPVTFLIV